MHHTAFQCLKRYLRQHPEITAIDSLENCENWQTREQFFVSLNACLNVVVDSIKVRTPCQITLGPGEVCEESAIRYPVLVKANTASVTEMAHVMSIVFNRAGLEKALGMYREDTVVQEFINHDMTVYKIYVLGELISCSPRQSCSNVSCNDADLVTFNSAEPWSEDIKSGERIVRELDMGVVRTAAQRIEKAMGLSIYGFDVLVQRDTGDYVVVDVNVFPGFKEYSELGECMEALIEKKISEGKEGINHCNNR